MKHVLLIFFFSIVWINAISQQVPDTNYNPEIPDPEYQKSKGPVIFIDEGHHNFHTKEGRYKAFSNLLERDGYVVKPYDSLFEKHKLERGKILVISNALHEKNINNWSNPTFSAFSKKEISTVENWVKEGGSLFLIADHMPFGGAAINLASSFGFTFTNGFAVDTTTRGPSFFNLEEKSLIENSITKGRNNNESVNQIATFTGQAFQIPSDAQPILQFKIEFINLLPDTAWVFNEKTNNYNVKNWYQGAYKNHGKGRIVVFGEAAMFSAQLAGPKKIKAGMNNPVAPENYKLLLNIIHWLDGKLE